VQGSTEAQVIRPAPVEAPSSSTGGLGEAAIRGVQRLFGLATATASSNEPRDPRHAATASAVANDAVASSEPTGRAELQMEPLRAATSTVAVNDAVSSLETDAKPERVSPRQQVEPFMLVTRASGQEVNPEESGTEIVLPVQESPTTPAATALVPPSPSHAVSPGAEVWLTEPTSIDEPLLLLDEEQERRADAVSQLRAELAEARAASKADRAALDALEGSAEALEHERDTLRAQQQRLNEENGVLRLELQDHHGIMAADWAQTLGFQEQLRREQAAHQRLAREAAELREEVVARAEEVEMLRQDASRWQMLLQPEGLRSVRTGELDGILEVALSAMVHLHAEARARSRALKQQLHDELEQQLCAVCKDAKKTVLFMPCQHVCVCESCRGRLRPYRCPICQEPVQGHVERVHF